MKFFMSSESCVIEPEQTLQDKNFTTLATNIEDFRHMLMVNLHSINASVFVVSQLSIFTAIHITTQNFSSKSTSFLSEYYVLLEYSLELYTTY